MIAFYQFYSFKNKGRKLVGEHLSLHSAYKKRGKNMTIGEIIKNKDKETYNKLREIRGRKMGLHSKSNKETRKRKYADQFAKTAENKKRKQEKRERKYGKKMDKTKC